MMIISQYLVMSSGDTFEGNSQPDLYAYGDMNFECYKATGFPTSEGLVTCTVSGQPYY